MFFFLNVAVTHMIQQHFTVTESHGGVTSWNKSLPNIKWKLLLETISHK